MLGHPGASVACLLVSTPAPTPIADGLVRHAQDHPDRPAVWDDQRRLTFGELDALAGTLACTLLEHFPTSGDGTSPILPIIVGFNVESVVAVQAATRAGLMHAPIEANSPAAMVADLVERLGRPTAAVITQPEQSALLPAGVTPLLVPTDAGPTVAPQAVDENAGGVVIFTAGSTGRPKGVVLDWESFESRNDDVLIDLGQADPPPTALMSPVSYAFGHWRALAPGNGYSVSIINPLRTDALDLVERIDRERIPLFLSVPALASSLTGRWPAGRRLEHVKEFHTFGEALAWGHVPDLRAILPDHAPVVSRYGSTEAFWTMAHYIPSDLPLGSGAVPLGTPLPGMGIWLEPVDPADPDSPRQIVHAGPHRAIGYLHEPELTAARFGVDESGRRFWRSGDIARIDDAGVYHRIGRMDDLVKIRGKLAEPAEPERVLRAMPGIREAVVLPQPTEDGTARFVGHLELVEGSTLTAGQVRAHVEQSVAPHLVPSILVRHDRLPRNDVGKIDRRTLLAEAPVPWRTATPRPLADDYERFVVSAAASVLATSDIQPDDDLWELGLDSLAAVELTVILEDGGWQHLEPAMLLEHRSPAALARMREDVRLPSEVVWMNRDGTRPPLFCVPGGGGTAMAYRWLAAELGPDQPLMVVEPRGLHSPGRPDRTVEQVAARVLRHAGPLASVEPITLVGYSGGGVVVYEAASRLTAQGRQVRVVMLDAPAGTASAAAGPPQRGYLVPEPTAPQAAKRAAMRTWLRVFPASTVPREQRYRAYYHLGAAAMVRYRPGPARFPITYFHPADSQYMDQWRGIDAHLDLVEVGGDHYTMLEPPNVAMLARGITAVLEARPPYAR
jgi:acyl-coenzyme A synthetase/AMP-(fatty) acid ligase/thioesterase domain-containing protein